MQMISLTIFAYLLQRLLILTGGMRTNWVAHPIPLEFAFWMLPAAVVMIHGVVLSRRAGFWGLWSGLWSWWALLSLVCAWKIPGASYVPLLPLTIAALAALPFTLRKTPANSAARSPESDLPNVDVQSGSVGLVVLLPLAASATLGFGPALVVYDALGGWAIVALAALIGLILTPLTPLCVELRDARGFLPFAIPGVPVAILALAAFASMIAPPFSASSPEHMNIQYWQNSDAGSAQWIIEPDSGYLPESLRVAAPFSSAGIGPFPWNRAPKFLADAPHLNLAPPTFTILGNSQADSKQSYLALLRSERAAPVAMVLFPPGSQVTGVRVGGIPAAPETGREYSIFRGWSVYACDAMPEQGVEISFSLPVGKPVEISAMDQTYGLPLDGQFLLKARPPSATPANAGDVTIVSRNVRVFP
jgi:FtsH-binding integral membrane protein